MLRFLFSLWVRGFLCGVILEKWINKYPCAVGFISSHPQPAPSLPWSECRRIAFVSQKHSVVDSRSFLWETFLPSQSQRQERVSRGIGAAWSWACCCMAGFIGCDLLLGAADCLAMPCHQHHRCSYTGMKANSLDLSLQCCWFFSVELPEPVLLLHLVL